MKMVTEIYFQKEFSVLGKHIKTIKLSEDYKNVKEVPDFRREQHMGAGAENTQIIMPSNLEYFYTAEESSERIWRFDVYMNRLYGMLKYGFALFFLVAGYRHIK